MFDTFRSKFISTLTFPGIVFNKILHRFFCDINNVLVYEVNYFKPWSLKPSYIINAEVGNFSQAFYIAIGPFIISSLTCMLLTFFVGIHLFLGTDFMAEPLLLDKFLQCTMVWIGYSIGYHAFPNVKDVNQLEDLAYSEGSKRTSLWIKKVVCFLNIEWLNFLLRITYTYLLLFFLPALFLL